MGDRANIYLIDRSNVKFKKGETVHGTKAKHGVYLYTHSKGYTWPEELRKALDSPVARRRWDDEPYLIRILAAQMFADLPDDLGGGISSQLGDNSYPITVVDIPGQMIAWAMQGQETDRSGWYYPMSFTEFVGQTKADYPK